MQKIREFVLALSLVVLAAPAQAVELTPTQIKAVQFFSFQGVAEAQTILASLYEVGKGVEQDIPEAVELYRKAADQNYPEAEYRLGSLYERGVGVERDAVMAGEWYGKACTHGFDKGCQAAQALSGSGK